MMHSKSAHLFALWYASLSKEGVRKGAEFLIKESALITRISSILRLAVGEQCILFDRSVHGICSIKTINKKYITLQCEALEQNEPYSPAIVALLPLLKKDDLATAVTQLVASGVSAIQLLTTTGVQRSWGGVSEYERIERLMVAAAEQSKYFNVPDLYEPITLEKALLQYKRIVYGDAHGKPFKDVFHDLPHLFNTCAVLVGPESDFTAEEKLLLESHQVTGYALTPTVLRSYLAITILVGSLRSWYCKKSS